MGNRVDPIWAIAAVAGWCVLLLDIFLSLRVVRWLLSLREHEEREKGRMALAELRLDNPAPPFRAADLAGRAVTESDYLGRETVMVFVSPHCPSCRREMRGLQAAAEMGSRRVDATVVLVSDGDAESTQRWLATMEAEDRVDVRTPVLVAPRNQSEFLVRYNPRALTPYFCRLDREGKVTARGGLHSAAWAQTVRSWGAVETSAVQRA